MTQAARSVGNGRFRVIGLLGEGGMARVYRAVDESNGALVAVKQLREPFASDPAIVERFRNEAQAAAALNHPNIVRVVEVGDDAGDPYLVLELIEGGDLRARLRSEGPLPIPLVFEIGQQLCAALAVAHARGIIHRDVKPQNVLLDKDEHGDLQIKLTDFGIARALGSASQTRTGEILGSVHYLSPEQIRGRPATAQSDLYAVGCVLYELITGRVPFEAETDIAVAMLHLQRQPAPPSRLRPGTPRLLDDIVLRCLSKDPAQRFKSATELQEALRRAAAIGEQATSVVQVSPRRPPRQPADHSPSSRPRQTASPPTRHGAAGTAVNIILLVGIAAFLLVLGGVAFTVASSLVSSAPAQQANAPQTPVPTISAEPTAVPTPTVAASPTPAPTATPTPPQLRAVPVLAGLSVEQARAELQRVGLRLVEAETRYDEQFPAGHVIAQSPVPSTEVEIGSEVSVVVSRGSSRVELPRLTGLTLDLAIERAELLGITVEPEEVFNSTVPTGTIFAQHPDPGELVERGSTVSVQVSKGPELVTVPDVVGLPEEEAKQRILATGKLKLWPFGTNYQGHDTLPDEVLRRVPVGAVLSTRPAGGTQVPPGTEVAIAVRKD